MHTILIAESDDHALRAHGDELLLDGYEVESAQTQEHARSKLSTSRPDALLLATLETPGATLALLRALRAGEIARADPRLPVITIGADTEHAAIRHYDTGADIVLAANPSPLLVAGALAALAARSQGDRRRRAVLRVGSLTIDSPGRVATIDGMPIQLTRLEFDLLEALARDPHTVLTRQQLARQVWNTEYVSGRTIDSHATRVRTKLANAGAEPLLQTVRGVGYRLGG